MQSKRSIHFVTSARMVEETDSLSSSLQKIDLGLSKHHIDFIAKVLPKFILKLLYAVGLL
jgi:hypothetical protein